jgi:hypothetical protein
MNSYEVKARKRWKNSGDYPPRLGQEVDDQELHDIAF